MITVNRDEILRHLDDILASPAFNKSKRAGEFLSWVVTQAVNDGVAFITERNIAIHVYRRREDFDPKLSATVRAEAMRLRNKLRDYYETAAPGGPRIEISKGTYVPSFIGFAEFGVAETEEVRESHWLRLSPRVAAFGMVVVVVVLGWGVWLHSQHRSEEDGASKLMAEAERLWRIGERLPAARLLDQVPASDRNSVAFRLEHAKILLSLGHTLEARAETNEAAKLASGRPLLQLAVSGEQAFANGDSANAVSSFKTLLREKPDSFGLRLQLADAEIQASDFAGAFRDLAELRRMPGGIDNPYLDRLEAYALGVQGKPKEGLTVLLRGERKAAKLHANATLARMLLLEGGLRQNTGDDNGVPLLHYARELCAPLHDDLCVASTYRVEGNRMVFRGRFNEALRLYGKALPLARAWGGELELSFLMDGLEAALGGLDSKLTPQEYVTRNYLLLSR